MDSGSTQEARKEDQQVKKRKRQRSAEDTEKDLQRTQRTGKRWTDTQIAGHTDRKKKTEEQIDKNKQAMSQADRGRGNQLNNHSHN